jgi:nucleoside-diphosphate-sugar epimerase
LERTIILGCGYVGQRLLRSLVAPDQAMGERGRTPDQGIIGVARCKDTLAAIAAAGGQPLQLDLDLDPNADLNKQALDSLPTEGALVFHFIPPPPDGEEDPRTARLIEHFAHHGHPRRLIYISTTGVYGDCQGQWVDETWPLRPGAARSQRRVHAEQQLQVWAKASGADLIILRVAGIYAADRLPLERIRQRAPVVKPEQAPWTNRIHAADLVAVCLAAAGSAPAGALYNVCDGHPSTMTDYFLRVARAAGLPPPPQIDLQESDGQLSPGMLSYLRESRRLDNRRLREELGVILRYPDLAAGLAEVRAA